MTQSSIKNFLMILTAALVISACGSGQGTSSEGKKAEIAGSGASKSTGELVKIVVNSNDELSYNVEEIKVPAGSTVELTLNHVGSFPKESMGHNLVILSHGVDLKDYAQRAMSAADNEYVLEGEETIAATKVIGGGESTTITFAAPAAGTYQFVCTFPGHYFNMQGDFIVE